MSTSKTYQCRKISEGQAQGMAMVSADDLCFYLVEPKTGVIIEEGHAAKGSSVSGKILVFPSGKGSSVVQADGIYQLQLQGNGPKAMIVRHPDTVLVASAIICGIPMVSKVEEAFYAELRDGDDLVVDADRGLVAINRQGE